MLSRGIDMAGPIKPENLGMFQSYFPGMQQPYSVVSVPNSENAWVRSERPNTVYIDPKYQNIPGIFEHEFEHQLNLKAAQRYAGNEGKKWDWPEYNFWEKNSKELGLNPDKTIDLLKNRVSNSVLDINKILKEKTGNGLALGSRLWSAKEQPLHELLAELSAIESASKVDFTKDKTLREKIFGDNEKIAQLYRSVTSGRQDRLDAKDLAPYTVQQQELSPWDRVVNILKNSLD